jgi:hypothetical protein
MTFAEFYKTDLQAVYALCVVPLVFLGWLLLSPAARAVAVSTLPWQRFVYAYSVVFALETILDPIATGPFVRWLGAGDTGLGTAILLTFVLLGDFRVYLLLFRLGRMERPLAQVLTEAAAWTFIVPVFAFVVDSALHAVRPGLPEQSIWLVYELAFLSIALWLRTGGIARLFPLLNDVMRVRLEAVAAYVAVYYALWASADVVIMVLRLDIGWALRVIPNQLYYAFYLPFVWFQTSSKLSTQASR